MNAIAFMSQAEPIAPLVRPEVTMRGMDFMALHYQRLRKSIAWLRAKRKPELGFYMMNLWGTAFHETPAGSLENDDDVLADAAMCSPERWAEVRDDVLHGWIRCSDGRLYSRFLAEVVNEAWERRKSHAARGAEGAAARWSKRDAERDMRPVPPYPNEAPSQQPNSCGMAEPKPTDSYRWDKDKDKDKDNDNEKEGPPPPDLVLDVSVPATRKRAAKRGAGEVPEGFNEFWQVYPNSAGKAEAVKAWPAAVKRINGNWRLLVAAAERYAGEVAGKDPQYVKHASGWLNGSRWQDAPKRAALDPFDVALGLTPAAPAAPAPMWHGGGPVIDGEATEAPEPRRMTAAEQLAEQGVPL